MVVPNGYNCAVEVLSVPKKMCQIRQQLENDRDAVLGRKRSFQSMLGAQLDPAEQQEMNKIEDEQREASAAIDRHDANVSSQRCGCIP